MTTTVTVAADDFSALGAGPSAGTQFIFNLVHVAIDGVTDRVTSTKAYAITLDNTGAGTAVIPDAKIGNGLAIWSTIAGWQYVYVANYPSGTLSLTDLVNGFQVDPATLAPSTAPASWNVLLTSLTARVTALEAGGGGGAVSSVAGRTGAVVLTKGDVALSNVDNTTDASKPVSAAQAAADAAVLASSAQRASNLSDLASAATARTNLGLGSAATAASTAFDTAGAAAAAQTAAQSFATSAVATETSRATTAEGVNAAGIISLALTPTVVKTTTYTAAPQDLVLCDATSGPFTVTLPSAPADKTLIEIKKIDTSTNTVTFVTGGTDVFNRVGGATTGTLVLTGQSVTARYQASTGIWIVLTTDTPLSGLDARFSTPAAVALVTKGIRRTDAAARTITIMATLPTITLSAANAATAISGSTLRAPLGTGGNGVPIDMLNDPNFSYSGTPSMTCGTTASGNSAYASAPVLTGSNAFARYAPSTSFQFYGDSFEIVFKALAATWPYRLRVDGQWATQEATYLSGLTVGAVYRILVAFGSVGSRKIQIDWSGSAFGGVQALPAHSIHRLSGPADIPTIVAAADSITASANSGTAAGSVRLDTWITYTAALLGWRNVYNAAIAGTGFVTAGTDTAFTGRLADIAVTGARVIIYGGLNDVGFVATTLPAAIDTVFAAIVAAGPAEFIVLGCHPRDGSSYANSGYIAVNSLLASKAAQYGATFIDTFVLAWVNGTGNFTTPNGTGNADLFVNADTVHPTRAGHQYMGRVLADAIAAKLPILAA